MSHRTLHGCQHCSATDLRTVIFLGFQPPPNLMMEVGQAAGELAVFPNELAVCNACNLAQLRFAVEPRILFPSDYPYTSGSTRALRAALADLCADSQRVVQLAPGDLVVDLGSNDGTLLAGYRDAGCKVVGVEPTDAADLAIEKGIATEMTFFNQAVADSIRAHHGAARLVTAASVLAHVDDVHELMRGVVKLLADDGVFAVELHYLPDTIASVQYDTIYHEHLRYCTLANVARLFEMYGLRVFHAQRVATHGGSIRAYASRSPRYTVTDAVAAILADEAAGGFHGHAWAESFSNAVRTSRNQLLHLLGDLYEQGKTVYGVGAPTRATTLVNYVGLDDGLLPCTVEIPGSRKLGKYIPGTRIPVLEEARLFADQPPYALMLAWHIGPELCRVLKKHGYRGDFIIPLPTARILRNAEIVV